MTDVMWDYGVVELMKSYLIFCMYYRLLKSLSGLVITCLACWTCFFTF